MKMDSGHNIALIGGLLIVASALYAGLSTPQIVTDLKSGDKSLECLFSDGWRDIPKDKIVGLDDVSGRWLFTNGSAKTCEIY